MSRVFDALQEAARHRGSNGVTSEPVWTELGITPATAPIPKIEKEVMPVRASSVAPSLPAAMVLEAIETTPEVEADEVEDATSHEHLLDGPSGKILLDKTARLIPHTTDPIIVERYRMLRTKILQEREKKFFRSLVVTSAGPQEGKTVTVLNLALSFAALPSFKVLVVDGDMRKGTLGDWLGIDRDRPGLSNLLEGSAGLEQVLLKSEELSLHVIPRGNAHICDLQSSQFDRCFRQLSDQFDLVLIDTPPVNLITDVQIMAAS